MHSLPGIISDKLRKLFGSDVKTWPAIDIPEAISDMPKADYVGIKLGGRKKGKHRA